MPSPLVDEELSPTAAILLWDQQLDELDYYAILGVTDQDSVSDYERAYHRFALQFHPDCYPNLEPPIHAALTRIFQRGVEARRVLSEPQLHARYRMLVEQGKKRMLDDSPLVAVDLARELPHLHEGCRSAGAKLEAMAAARAFPRTTLEVVRQHLASALVFDGNANTLVRACLEAVEQSMSQSRSPRNLR